MTAWTDEQLAAFISGELDVSEASELTEALRSGGDLADRVAAIRRTDALLGSLAAPEPTAEFSARLRTAIDVAVSEVVGDELAARRQQRAGLLERPWLLRGAAGLVAVAAGIGLALSFGGGSNDAATTAAQTERLGEDLMSGAGEAADDGAADSAMAAPFGDRRPLVTDNGEVLTDDLLAELATSARDRFGFVGGEADQLALDNEIAMVGRQSSPLTTSESSAVVSGSGTADSPAPGPESAATESGVSGSTTSTISGSDGLQIEGDVSEEDLERVAACLEPVLAASRAIDQTVIALEARLGNRDGVASIAYFLLSANTDGEFSRVETWIVDRSTCDVTDYISQ